MSEDKIKIIYIGGPSRAGTTLLGQFLKKLPKPSDSGLTRSRSISRMDGRPLVPCHLYVIGTKGCV